MIKVTAVVLGHAAYWTMLLLAILLALFQLALYLISEPVSELAEGLIEQNNQTLSEALGQPVEISYSNLQLGIRLDGLHLVVDKPSISIGETVLDAPKAQLVVGFGEGVTLHIDSPNLQFVEQEDGSFTLAGAALPVGLAGNASRSADQKLPTSVIATNTQISFLTTKGELYELTDLNLSGSFDAIDKQMQVSFFTNNKAAIGARGRINYVMQSGDIQGYVRIRDAQRYLDKLGFAIDAESSFVDIWANYDGNALDATLHAEASNVSMPLEFATATQESDSSSQPPYQMNVSRLALHSKLEQPLILKDIETVRMDWTMETQGINVNLSEPYLGAPLLLDKVAAQGKVRYGEQGWGIVAPDIRVQGPIGVGKFSLEANQSGTQQPYVNARGSAPMVDYATLASLLPLSIGEPGVIFLRDDLQVTQMQLSTLVVQGSEWDKFPWPDDDGGKFRLGADFFGASLDYSTGYPKLVDAIGAMTLEGTALAVAIVDGSSSSAKVEIARAGIADMDAVEATLFVAADLQLPDGGLFTVLETLPDTKDDAAAILGDLRLSGRQGLGLEIAVPLDTDNPVEISGVLRPSAGNELTYVPLDLTLSDLSGDFNFNRDGVNGTGFAKMLDTGVRLLLEINDGEPQVQIDGTFDLAAAMSKLNIGDGFPFEGSSQITAKASGNQISLNSSLEGTKIDLPSPFGKPSSKAMQLQVRIGAQGTNLDYGDGLLKATISPDGKSAFAFNAEQLPKPRTVAGTQISGTLPNLDIDGLTQSAGGGFPLAQPIEIDLNMPGALLLGIEHPLLKLQATVASTATVAVFDSQAINGELRQDENTALAISLSYLRFPESEDAPDLDSTATIYVEPGTLSPALPALDLTIDELQLGKQLYGDVKAKGEPQEDIWQLTTLYAKMPGKGNEITASGITNTAGEPYTHIDLDITSSDLGSLVGGLSEGESVKEGTATLQGSLDWEGSLSSPHFLTMRGSLDLQANEFVLNRDSQGVKLLNLLSPFTLLSNLDNIAEEGFRINEAKGTLVFGEGLLNFEKFDMKGKDIDISVAGNTNLITEHNNMTSYVKIKKSDNVATTAVAVTAPLAGAFLLFSDKVLGMKILGDLEVAYDISGTWDEPITRAQGAVEEQPDQEKNQ